MPPGDTFRRIGRPISPVLRARCDWPRGCRTTAEKRDEFPPPHRAYPKAKDHELIIAPCIAAKNGHSRPKWAQNENPPFSGLCQLPPAADTILPLLRRGLPALRLAVNWPCGRRGTSAFVLPITAAWPAVALPCPDTGALHSTRPKPLARPRALSGSNRNLEFLLSNVSAYPRIGRWEGGPFLLHG